MRNLRTISLFIIAVFCCCGTSFALEEEEIGNSPLSELNYKDWPGVMPLISNSSRVFHVWVNGNELFYYRGNTDVLNLDLRKFANIQSKAHEVVLRPGSGIVSTWDQKQQIPFDWNLHLVGGIAGYMSKQDLGNIVWNPSPVLTIYVDGNIQLAKIQIPPGTVAICVADLAQRYRKALSSKNEEVRGWSSGALAELDPYDGESVAAITELLKDNVNWVRLNAAYALPLFGRVAEPALPALREALNTPDADLKARIQKAIDEIQQAKDNSAAQREHRDRLKSIADFCNSIQH